MLLKFTIIPLVLLILGSSFYKSGTSKTCNTEIDNLTKRVVYTSADFLPENEGGPEALAKKLQRMPEDTTFDAGNYNPNYTIAFIVNVDGSVSGERVVDRGVDVTVRQLFAIVKSFK